MAQRARENGRDWAPLGRAFPGCWPLRMVAHLADHGWSAMASWGRADWPNRPGEAAPRSDRHAARVGRLELRCRPRRKQAHVAGHGQPAAASRGRGIRPIWPGQRRPTRRPQGCEWGPCGFTPRGGKTPKQAGEPSAASRQPGRGGSGRVGLRPRKYAGEPPGTCQVAV